METVFDWTVAQGWRMDNPAGRALLKVLPSVKWVKSHHAALPYTGVQAALHKVRLSTSLPSTKLALEFMVLTAARSGEVRAAEWSEFDWNNWTWIVPAERMKASREHRVPLSNRAMDVLRDACMLTSGEGLVFPAKGGAILSDMTFTGLLRRLEIPAVPHGFRSSFRDWVAEQTATPWAVAEAALARTIGNSTEQAYMRSDLFERRRVLMEDWAHYLTQRRAIAF